MTSRAVVEPVPVNVIIEPEKFSLTELRGQQGTAAKPRASTPRIPSLDGLRGLSIWAVMLAHASSHFSANVLHDSRVHRFLAPMAYFGVTTFFVISGFLITKLLLGEYAKASKINLGQFYQRRAARILPAAFCYIGIVLIAGRVTASQALVAVTFTTTYFYDHAAIVMQQLWSLSVEEQFYFLWPLAFWLGPKSARNYCWALVFLSPAVRVILKHGGYTQYAHLAPAIGDSLAVGCLLAFHEARLREFARKYLLSTPVFLTLCVLTLGAAGLVYSKDVVVLWGLVPGLTAFVVSAAIERQDPVLNKGVLVWTGLLSYSLYLWQQPFLVFDGPLNYLSVRLTLTFVLAYLSFRFVEKPALSYFGRLRRATS